MPRSRAPFPVFWMGLFGVLTPSPRKTGTAPFIGQHVKQGRIQGLQAFQGIAHILHQLRLVLGPGPTQEFSYCVDWTDPQAVWAGGRQRA